MKKIKPLLQIILYGSLTFLVISLVFPFFLQRLTESRQKALNTVAFNVAQELEEAINKLNLGDNPDSWILNNSAKLDLEPWGLTESFKPQYRFLTQSNKNLLLKTYDIEYLRENFIVIYEGNGKFRVKSLNLFSPLNRVDKLT